MILIASPHLDDEVLGCASFLGAGDPPGEDVAIVYTTATHPEFPEVLSENGRLMERTGAKPYWPANFDRINELDQLGQAELIAYFEKVINDCTPATVLVPAMSYNQDHRAVHEAMLTACRPHDRNWYVKRVLAYEEPETFGSLRRGSFHPHYFRRLDIGAKIALYGVYSSQVRAHRSIEHLEAIAQVRGMQANARHAEAFEVLRWVE
jgi:LmbE family N-acetylglucosaminyl deacetylase